MVVHLPYSYLVYIPIYHCEFRKTARKPGSLLLRLPITTGIVLWDVYRIVMSFNLKVLQELYKSRLLR